MQLEISDIKADQIYLNLRCSRPNKAAMLSGGCCSNMQPFTSRCCRLVTYRVNAARQLLKTHTTLQIQTLQAGQCANAVRNLLR